MRIDHGVQTEPLGVQRNADVHVAILNFKGSRSTAREGAWQIVPADSDLPWRERFHFERERVGAERRPVQHHHDEDRGCQRYSPPVTQTIAGCSRTGLTRQGGDFIDGWSSQRVRVWVWIFG